MPPHNKAFDDGYGVYVWPPTGERFVSVTAFLSVINKPPLLRWAAKMAATWALTHHQEWQGLEFKEAVDLISSAPFDSNESKSDLGTRVHEAVEQEIRSLLDEPGLPLLDLRNWDHDVVPYMQQFHLFLEEHDPQFAASEFTVYNRTHDYAGTGDILAYLNTELWLLDVKTGKWAYPEAALQLSAYSHGEFIGMQSEYEQQMPRIEKAGVLLLRPRSYKLLPLLCDPFDEDLFEGFLAARDLWHWQKHYGEKVFPPRPFFRGRVTT